VAFAERHETECDLCGKSAVAVDEAELPMLDKINRIGLENGIEGIEKIDAKGIKKHEPFCEGVAGIWVPVTGIIDFRAATAKMVELALTENGQSKLALGEEVMAINPKEDYKELKTTKGIYKSRYQVFCAGLQAD